LPNIFIFGSCVSRDTQPFLGPDWGSAKYIARQSMISATSPKAKLEGESALTSKFQNECLYADFESSLFPAIDEHADETDIFVIDLVDERKGVYEVSPGVYITHTWELEESKLLEKQPTQPRRIVFGTDEHFKIWAEAADKVMVKMASVGRPVIVLAPEWAETSDEGHTNLDIRGKTAAEYNLEYVRYIEHLRGCGVTIFTAGQDMAVAAV
jgi:hypothetical protein